MVFDLERLVDFSWEWSSWNETSFGELYKSSTFGKWASGNAQREWDIKKDERGMFIFEEVAITHRKCVSSSTGTLFHPQVYMHAHDVGLHK